MAETHPLSFTKTSVWFNLLKDNKDISSSSFFVILYVSILSILLSPIRFVEKLIFKHKITNTKLDPSPIFILGHWRSGTTFLQTLLSKDPNLGYLCGFQAFMPGLELIRSKLLYQFLNLLIPKKRAMDNMPRGLDVPEEEEFPLSANSKIGVYHSLWFPRNNEYFEKYCLHQNITNDEKENWKKQYLFLLKKISLFQGKKRLVLKNPPNTARIEILLDLFPEAKFINIYRNPYTVFLSMKNMYKKSIIPLFLQKMNDEEINEKILSWYEQVMKKYIAEVKLIPKENLIDLKYENFEKDPLMYLEQTYDQFKFDFINARPHFLNYLNNLKNYQKNKHELPKEIIKLVNSRWKFSFEYFGYELLGD